MDGNAQAGNKPCNAKLLSYEYSHPCALDPGNPCRDDGVSQTLVYNEESWSLGTGVTEREKIFPINYFPGFLFLRG